MVEALLTDALAVANGDEVRRRKVVCSEGEDGDIARPEPLEPPEGLRECDEGSPVALTERVIPPDVVRDLAGGAGGDEDSLRGEAGRVTVVLEDMPGEPARFVGGP